jgi:hypothetical protein
MQSTAIARHTDTLCGVERMVRADAYYQLWVEDQGDPQARHCF